MGFLILATLLNFAQTPLLSYFSVPLSLILPPSLLCCSHYPKLFFILIRNSSIVTYYKLLFSKLSKIFSFQIFTNPPYIYDKTYWICSSTITSLILILIYSLHAIKNPEILLTFLLNISSLATSMFNLILGLEVTISLSPPAPPLIANNACNSIIYSCYCLIWSRICFILKEPYWLML